MTISTVKPIQIVPIPDGTTNFTTNTLVIGAPIYDTNDKTDKKYDHIGVYTVSSSSYLNNTTMPYKAFDGNKDTFWQCNTKGNTYDFSKDKITVTPYSQPSYTNSTNGPSAYIGGGVNNANFFKTTVGGTTVAATIVPGEWLQIQLPDKNPVYLFRYTIVSPPKSSSGTVYFPKKFIVVGSKTGKDDSWVYLNQQNLVDPPPNNANTMTFDVSSTEYYFFYRFIFGEMYQGNDVVRINEITLFGNVEETPNSSYIVNTLGTTAVVPATTGTTAVVPATTGITGITALVPATTGTTAVVPSKTGITAVVPVKKVIPAVVPATTATNQAPATVEEQQSPPSDNNNEFVDQSFQSGFTNMGDSKKLNYYAFSNMNENSSPFKISTPNPMPKDEIKETCPDTNHYSTELFNITSYVSIVMTIAISAIILYSIKK